MGHIQSSNGAVLHHAPAYVYEELEYVYKESTKEGGSGTEEREQLYRRLENLYQELCLDHLAATSQNDVDESSSSMYLQARDRDRNLSSYLLELSAPSTQATSAVSRPVSPYTSHQSTPRSSPRPSRPTTPKSSPPSDNRVTSNSRSNSRLLTYRSPSANGSVTRPRPKSSSKIDPYRIDRARSSFLSSSSSSSSPRRSQMIRPRIKMHFETLWYISWVSVARRLDLDPLTYTSGFPDTSKFPVMENNYELILLIYLLRSLCREYESQVRCKLRILSKKSSTSLGSSGGVTVAAARSKLHSNLSILDKSESCYMNQDAKSIEEVSLQASLRLMHECHQFQDSFFAAIEPTMPSWREETDVLMKNLLNDYHADKIAMIGSTSTLAFHLVRSIEFIVEGKKPSPIQEDQAARGWPMYNKGSNVQFMHPSITYSSSDALKVSILTFTFTFLLRFLFFFV